MPHLFIVAGASGAGKSFLLQNMRLLESNMVPVKKLTTRAPRDFEDEPLQAQQDLEFNCTVKDVVACDYHYPYGKDWYGIRKKDIAAIIEHNQNPVVIVRNSESIRKMKRDFPDAGAHKTRRLSLFPARKHFAGRSRRNANGGTCCITTCRWSYFPSPKGTNSIAVGGTHG